MKKEAANLAQSSVMGFANVLAIAAAFLATGPISSATASWVVESAVSSYGEDVAGFVRFGWMLTVAAGVFFLARAFIALALMFIVSFAVMRFGAFI